MTGLLIAAALTDPTWFGPAVVSFNQVVQGNPYDPAQNDAWVQFTGPRGETAKVLAYFDDGAWKSNLVAHHRGVFSATLTINGTKLATQQVDVEKPMPDGYIRTGGHWGFRFDSGKLYWPLGHDLGWQSGNGFPDLAAFLHTMGQNGINWSRIWACSWDGKNPWWPNDGTKLRIGELWPKAIHRWDEIVRAADSAGVHFQFVLFHHGEFSSTTDSNWKDNPWNTANGGFLARPEDFFTDARAMQLAKEWVRYAVARWGYSPSIMAWEIFNEVQWTDGARKEPEAVGAWHDKMADYIRSLDPAHHLITTSSDLSLPIWSKADYWQPHGYPARVESMVLAAKRPDSRPFFYGEVGPGQLDGSGATQTEAVRDGIWGGLFALDSGAAEYWTWDLVPRYHLHREYATARKILDESGVFKETTLKPARLTLDSGVGGDLKMAPGAGWEPNRTFTLNLPEGATTGMGGFSAFFQGKGHADMRPRPVVFHFKAPHSGKMRISIEGVSGGGASLEAKVNGAKAARRIWDAGAKAAPGEVFMVPFPAGEDTLELDNDGPDWVQLGSMIVPGISDKATAVGIADDNLVMCRIERTSPEGSVSVRLGGVPLDGHYRGALTNLDDGTKVGVNLDFKGSKADTRLNVHARDSILWLRRRG